MAETNEDDAVVNVKVPRALRRELDLAGIRNAQRVGVLLPVEWIVLVEVLGDDAAGDL